MIPLTHLGSAGSPTHTFHGYLYTPFVPRLRVCYVTVYYTFVPHYVIRYVPFTLYRFDSPLPVGCLLHVYRCVHHTRYYDVLPPLRLFGRFVPDLLPAFACTVTRTFRTRSATGLFLPHTYVDLPPTFIFTHARSSRFARSPDLFVIRTFITLLHYLTPLRLDSFTTHLRLRSAHAFIRLRLRTFVTLRSVCCSRLLSR